MFPRGFLGTRSDLLMDIVLVSIIATPFLMLYAFSLVRRGLLERHRNVQAVLITVLLLAVALFEVDIRASGGTRAFVKSSPLSNTDILWTLLMIHVLVAMISFIGWLVLALLSWRKFHYELPGGFSLRHRTFGKLIFSGAIFTAVSGTALYVMSFVI